MDGHSGGSSTNKSDSKLVNESIGATEREDSSYRSDFANAVDSVESWDIL